MADNFLGHTPSLIDERVTADGAFKTPSLRNCELTGPYFHNGSEASLQATWCSSIHVAATSVTGIINDVDFALILRVMGLIGHPNRQIALTELPASSLTDERVRWSRAPFDHPELVVP